MVDKKKLEKAFKLIIEALGDDPTREGLIDTPKRVAKMYKELLTCNKFKSTSFQNNFDDIVMVRDIEFTSMCEHHLLPFLWNSSYCLYSKW